LTAAGAADTAAAGSSPVRFFIDEGYFLEGDTEVLRAHIAASRGRLAISGESSAAFLSVKVSCSGGGNLLALCKPACGIGGLTSSSRAAAHSTRADTTITTTKHHPWPTQGYYSPDTWDVYWTVRQACHMAYKHMGPHQRVNCIPGVSAVSLKRNFVSTWQQVCLRVPSCLSHASVECSAAALHWRHAQLTHAARSPCLPPPPSLGVR
jgi:hypothetical protein